MKINKYARLNLIDLYLVLLLVSLLVKILNLGLKTSSNEDVTFLAITLVFSITLYTLYTISVKLAYQDQLNTFVRDEKTRSFLDLNIYAKKNFPVKLKWYQILFTLAYILLLITFIIL